MIEVLPTPEGPSKSRNLVCICVSPLVERFLQLNDGSEYFLPPFSFRRIVGIQDTSRGVYEYSPASRVEQLSEVIEIAALHAVSGEQNRHVVRYDLPHAAQVCISD